MANIKKLYDLHSKLSAVIEMYQMRVQDAETALKPYVDFEFSVEWNPGDGLTLLNVGTTHAATLIGCIGTIENHGRLTDENFKHLAFL